MSTFLIAQFIGTIALLFSVSVYQVNRRPMMLKLSLVANLLYSVHFFMLGAATGSAMNLLAALRSYSYFHLKIKDPIRALLLIAFIAAGIVATIFTWHGYISLFALAGNMANAFATWHTKPQQIRRWMLVAPPFWFVYDAVNLSYPGMLIQIICLVSNLIGEYRFDVRSVRHDRTRLARNG